jgi:hypothetical protein
MTSQCCPTTSTRSSTSLLSAGDMKESDPRPVLAKAHPARRSASIESTSESCPGAEVDKCVDARGFMEREDDWPAGG